MLLVIRKWKLTCGLCDYHLPRGSNREASSKLASLKAHTEKSFQLCFYFGKFKTVSVSVFPQHTNKRTQTSAELQQCEAQSNNSAKQERKGKVQREV